MKQKQTTVMIVLLAIAMITVPIASAGVTAFNVAPTTTTCDTNSSYTVQVNTTGFESLNITIPAGYTAVVPEGVYTVNITWINTTTGLGGQNNTEMITLSGGGTYVSGFISTNTTWTLTGSPYIVIGDVIVEEGVELTINPDVIVKFDSGKSLIIDGILNARGNAANKIVFTSNATTPASGDWGTIKFRDSSVDSACIIDWAIVEYGSTGITCEDSSQIGSPRIENTVIKHNNIGVKITTTHPPHIAGPLIKNSAISNNSGNAVYIDAGAVNITGTTIQDNDGWGIKTSGAINAIYIIDSAIQNCSAGGVYGEYITLTGCTIAENGGNGVSGWVDVIISKSIIKSNIGHGVHHWGSHGLINIIQILIQNNTGTGIDCGSATQVFIEYSVITDNGQSGISNDGGAVHYNNIHYNNIRNNTIYNFKNGGSSDVNATYNWWGTINTTLIDQHIYDYYDDYNLGKVTYVPFLTEPVTPENQPPNASFTFSPSHPVTG
ncbi:MAG: hypothetical protein AEth_00214 [Candidatus Argoarchaeum ethanivorans]|uniref:Right handed beta helix domain-containing protein n=1 Tax=Candidatus Argoarchaeum ethanivorans TaxID=2608793 RepID=A0A8B3S777_9EURY|nr:MAG: hypothetical protein AEth_00214 [Candidatus Argoarchaeum ethanivorans]